MATGVGAGAEVPPYSSVDHDVTVKPSSSEMVFEISFYKDALKSSAVYKIPLPCTGGHNVKVKVFLSEASSKIKQEQTHKAASAPKLEITNNLLKQTGDFLSVTWKSDSKKGDFYLILDSGIPLLNGYVKPSVENKGHYKIEIDPKLYTKVDIRGFISSKEIQEAKVEELLKGYLIA